MGVTFENGKYRARISIGGNKRRSLGRYDTKLKAQRAIARYRNQDEATQEQLLQDHLDNLDNKTLLEQYKAAHPTIVNVPEQKLSLWDRIKSIWQNTKRQR